MIEVRGAGNIVVKIIADSIAATTEKRITTFELTYPRIIHSEIMTHRVFSRNAMSSRAVPIKTMIDLVRTSPAKPVEWGRNNPGMQSRALLDPEMRQYVESEWKTAAANAARSAALMDAYGAHKQIANRILEPFQMMRTVLTTTEFANFEWLRVDADADPTFRELARCMVEARENSSPETLQPHQWHTPYVDHYYDKNGDFCYFIDSSREEIKNGKGLSRILTEEEALAISASCCAQVSYRRLDETYEKAMEIFGRLLTGNKVHASPFEHQACPIMDTIEEYGDNWEDNDLLNVDHNPHSWQDGITHMGRDRKFWSGNFCGFIQHRQLLDNHVKLG